MAHPPPYPYYEGHPIYLYTTTLSYQRYLGFKHTIDPLGHWAICIQDRCYELKRDKKLSKKKADQYHIRDVSVSEWEYIKNTKEEGRPYNKLGPVGYTARPWPPHIIKEIAERVWNGPLQHKYVYDETNCQVFIRLLVDLIGNKQTQVDFPGYFDKWVKRAGTARDSVALISTAAMATVAAVATLAVTPADISGTAAAGFALSASIALRSTTALVTDRVTKGKFIKKAQEELREELKRRGILPY